MKVQFVSGPRAGQTTHVIRDRFSDLLLQAGVLELVEEDQPRPAHISNAESANIANHSVPCWGIFRAPRSGKPSIQCEYLRGVSYYDGPPERADKFRVGTHTPPPEIIAAYVRALAGEETDRTSNSEAERAKLDDARRQNLEAANAYLEPLLPWKSDAEHEAEQHRQETL
jgi:hypothetical protein